MRGADLLDQDRFIKDGGPRQSQGLQMSVSVDDVVPRRDVISGIIPVKVEAQQPVVLWQRFSDRLQTKCQK